MNIDRSNAGARVIEGDAAAQVGNVTDGPGTQGKGNGSADQQAITLQKMPDAAKDTVRLTVSAGTGGR